MIVTAIETMGETFNLIEKTGVDPKLFYEMITDTLFNSPIYKNYGKIITEKNYKEAGFTSQLGLKDTKLALGMADESSTPLPLGDLIRNRFFINHNHGRNDWDWTSIVKKKIKKIVAGKQTWETVPNAAKASSFKNMYSFLV